MTVRLIKDAADNSVTLMVEDNGPGIPEKYRKDVFKRFYRIAENNQDGCGLGLSIVREIALRHHTSVALTTPDGHSGCIFSVRFIIADTNAQASI